MTMALEILRLTPDSSRLTTVATWQFRQWGHLHRGVTLATWCERLRQQCGAGGVPSVFVAVCDGQPVGTASLVAHDLSIRRDLTPWLASVYVPPEWRRRSIASRLVARVEEEARRSGISRCYLFTPDQQGLYRRLGWEERDTLDYRGESVTIMTRSLEAPWG